MKPSASYQYYGAVGVVPVLEVVAVACACAIACAVTLFSMVMLIIGVFLEYLGVFILSFFPPKIPVTSESF